MKKTILLVVAAIGLAANSFAQSKVNVPAAVKTAFAKNFAGSTAKWEKEDGEFEAVFKQNGHEMSATFDTKGTLLETETEIKASELPAAANDYVKTHHKGASIKEAAKIVDAKGVTTYEAEVKGKDLIFDAKGAFLKEISKEEKD